MMKCISILMMLASFCSLHAQSFEVSKIKKKSFKGIEKVGNEGYYFSVTESSAAKKNIEHFYVLDNNLAKIADFTLELNINEDIEDLGFNGSQFLFLTKNRSEKYRLLRLLDKSGKELANEKSEKLKPATMWKDASILTTKTGEFVVINYVKEDKVGYRIDKYDNKLAKLYSTTKTPESKKLYVVDYLLKDNTLYLLEHVDAMLSDYFEYHVGTFDLASGKELTSNYLQSADKKSNGYALFLRETPTGAATGGMYFDNPREKEANSDGFFLATFNLVGTMRYEYVDWATVKASLKTQNTAVMWGGKSKTFMQDLIVNQDGSVTLVGETYRHGDQDLAGDNSNSKMAAAGKALKFAGNLTGEAKTESKPWAFTSEDFAMMDFDTKGAFVGARKVDKPSFIVIPLPSSDPNDQNYAGQMKGLNLAKTLNTFGYMPYRFSVKKDAKNYLGFLIGNKFYTTPSDAAVMDTISIDVTPASAKIKTEGTDTKSSKLGAFAQKMNSTKTIQLGKKSDSPQNEPQKVEFEIRGSYSYGNYRQQQLNSRVIPSNVAGKILVFDLYSETSKMKVSHWSQYPGETELNLAIIQVDAPTK